MRFLTDEHVPPAIRTQLLRLLPDADIWQVGSVGAPALSTLDPDILIWCEAHDFILVTNNRKSMPVHLADHLKAGSHVPGILTIDLSDTAGTLIQELKDIAELSLPDEYFDRIVYVPLKR
jgi:Domain of unknown function (DUF5615)